MNEPAPKKKPLWVRFALWGINSRGAALACLWFSVALTGFSAYLRLWYGLIVLLAAPGYWLTIRWMDKNAAWPNPPEN